MGPTRPSEQRSAENSLYKDRQAAAGIVRMSVMVPLDQVVHLRALTMAWRQEAKMVIESDLPTSDQILQIHAVCRTLRLKLPLWAFETRSRAERWLLAQEPLLEGKPALSPAPRPPMKRGNPMQMTRSYTVILFSAGLAVAAGSSPGLALAQPISLMPSVTGPPVAVQPLPAPTRAPGYTDRDAANPDLQRAQAAVKGGRWVAVRDELGSAEVSLLNQQSGEPSPQTERAFWISALRARRRPGVIGRGCCSPSAMR
jgi:hypothetical protein